MWNSKDKALSERQSNLIDELVADIVSAGGEIDAEAEAEEMFNTSLNKLTVTEAGEFITYLMAEKRYSELAEHIGETFKK